MPILNSLISSSIISKLISSLGFKTEPSVSIIENTSDAANAAFGAMLSVSDNYIVVGSPRQFPLSDTTIPEVRVYNFSGSGVFTLYNPSVGNTAYTSFGNSVGIANNYIIVGDSNYIANSTHRPGRAYVFNAANGASLYTLDNPNLYGNANDEFGHAVAISSQYAVVSAIGEDVTGGGIQPEGIDQGIAYVYNTANGALLYTLNNPEASDESYTAENFGFNVAITNTHVVIASPFEDIGTTFYDLNLGKVFVYSTANGSLLHTISYSDLDFGGDDPSYSSDQFGRAVGASPSYVIVGAPVRGEFTIGRAYLYSIANGSLLYTFTNPNATNYNQFTGGPGRDDFFGFSVAVTEQYAIVSAPFTENTDYYGIGANNTGRVYVYSTANGSLLHTIINPYVVGAYPGYSPGQSGFGSFGRGAAITPSGSSIVATRFATSGTGSVHIYSK